jgi:hypothetical protein
MKMCRYNKFSETIYMIDNRCQQYSVTSSFEVHSPAICYGLVYIFILSHSATEWRYPSIQYIYIYLFILTANGFSPGGSGK